MSAPSCWRRSRDAGMPAPAVDAAGSSSTTLRDRLLLPAACLLVTGGLLFPSSGRDDSYLTYWPAHTLASFGEILNLNGDRVEQSSSLLEVVLLAAAAKGTGLPLPVLGLLLSAIAGVACVALAFRTAQRLGPDYRGAAWLVATATPLVYWSFSGLESSLAALLALALVATYGDHLERRHGVLPGVRLAAVTLLFLAVRPETIFVLGCALAGLLVVLAARSLARRGEAAPFAPRPFARALGLCGVAALAFLPLALFRVSYFGSLFPQPVYAKSFSPIAGGGLASQVAAGGDYLVEHMGSIFLVGFWIGLIACGAAVRGLLRGVRAKGFEVFGAVFCAAYLGFVATTGGDYMEGARYVVPFLPVALMLACGLLRRELPDLAHPMLVGVVLLQLAGTLHFARTESTGIPLAQWLAEDFDYAREHFAWPEAANRVHRRDLEMARTLPVVISRVHAEAGRTVTVLSRQMGMVPFHVAGEQLGDVRFIDAYGLATRDITSAAFAPLLPEWRRSRFQTLFGTPEAIADAWGVARPDVVYDLRDPPTHLLERNGYTVVYRKSGRVESPSRLLPGGVVDAGAWIAVRDDHLPSLRISRAERPEG